MHNQQFLRLAGLLAIASAVTTFLLWLLPRLYAPPASFDESIAFHQNTTYLARLWVNFGHVAIALTAYAAAAAITFKRSPALSLSSVCWFVLWAGTELIGVAIQIFAVNATWRASYASASEPARAQLKAALDTFPAIWDAMFFVILIAFLMGTTFLGLAIARTSRVARAVAWLHLLAAPLTILIVLGSYAEQAWAGAIVGASYPILQPVSRTLLGVWLWREASVSDGVG